MLGRRPLTFRARRPSLKLPDAGWSSLVARRAHNPKVAGSNPAPATPKTRSPAESYSAGLWRFSGALFHYRVQNASKLIQRPCGASQVAFIHDVVPIEDCARLVTR